MWSMHDTNEHPSGNNTEVARPLQNGGEETTKNTELLKSFVEYCETHPQERFWQALRNWSGYNFIWASMRGALDGTPDIRDTFYWEKNPDHEA